MKTFTNKKGISYLFLEVPEDSHKFLIERYPSINEYQSLWFYENHGVERLHPKASIKLPQGNYELIGLSKDVSESQAAEIVHEYDELSLEGHGFEDYIGTSICDTAKESLSSLVQSLCLNNAIILKKI